MVCSFVCVFFTLEIMESVLTFHVDNFCKFHVLYACTGDTCALETRQQFVTERILVPSATRLKMSGRTKKFEFFHWLTKNECAAEMKITKLYAFHTFAQLTQARFTKKQMVTFPDRSEGIVKVST